MAKSTVSARSNRSLKPTKTAKTLPAATRIPAVRVSQNGRIFYLSTLPASALYRLTQINRRSEDKQEGYQRAISPARVRSIAKFIQAGGIIPGAITVSFDNGSFDTKKKELVLDGDADIGWVIDGQHRLAGAFEASSDGPDINLPVISFLDLPVEHQIDLFITINREARGVPASLYIDLLKDLPRRKTDRELLDERVADIARRISGVDESPFFQKIIFTRTARAGEISLVNFARIVRPLLARQSGSLGLYTQPEQEGAISNFFKALAVAFPAAWRKEVFFRTIGFGGVFRAFPLIMNLSISRYAAFNVASIAKVFSEISDFDFESWNEIGTGTAAEIQAGDDLIASLQEAFAADSSPAVMLKLD